MKKNITPYNNKDSKKSQVTKMFNDISKKYDFLNKIISFGADNSWRRKIAKKVKKLNPKNILDIATGTGDLAISLSKVGADKIIGLDISDKMLEVGKEKIKQKGLSNKIEMIVGDAENIPYKDSYFDVVTVAFGVRNYENLELGLKEIYRVLKPSGSIFILETSVPKNLFLKYMYIFYTHKIMPFFSALFSSFKTPYQYLSKSAQYFPHGKEFNNILQKIGFIEVNNYPQTLGVVTIYIGKKGSV